MKLVIVDDVAINRKLLRATLEAEGHTTLEAGDGVEALQILCSEKVDAVVSDILMPRMDGYRLCHEIRNNERLQDLPIVIYTATYTSRSDEKLARELGADKYLRKPASVGAILTAVQEAIDIQHAAPRPEALQDVEALREYSDRLVTKLDEKNAELEQRSRLAALSMDVRAVLSSGDSLKETLQHCSETLVRHLDAAFARIWTLNDREKVLELQASAGMYTHLDGPHSRVPVGQFKIGLIAAERKPHLTNSVIGDPRVSEQEWARREGLIAFAGYPLIVDGRLFGVMAMFTRYSFAHATWAEMGSIADAIALNIGRKQAEAELRSTHDKLHRLLALSPAVIYNLKIEGRNVIPTFVSDNIERLLGVTVAECLSSDWWLQSLHPEDRERMVATMAHGLQEGGYTAEYRIQHRDRSYRWLMDNNLVVRDAAGDPLEFVGVWTDISDHKQQQKINRRLEDAAADAHTANRAKSAFLSTMSHEIRTPMNAILGYAQLMLRDPSLGEEAKANLRIIGRSGEHLLGLINDILDMSKIEAGRTELNPATFNLANLLFDLAAMFRLRAEAKALRFEMLVDGESVPYVVTDAGKLRQALINLLGNAIKFTGRGRIGLHVTLEKRSAGLWLLARVEDSGVGISEEEQEKLFQPFNQAKDGLHTREGTGLGLSISRKYARLMGGDVTVASSVGKGSIFRFEIPIERGDAGVAVRTSAARRVIGLRSGTKVPGILVVDDQFENRDWLIKLLTVIGFSVQGAENGEAAIQKWEEWNPQLILMDVQMPVMDGLEATRRIKADPRGQDTAIVVLTASALDEDRQTVFQSGADDFVAKPCREEELLEKVRALLNIAYDYEDMSGAACLPDSGMRPVSAGKFRKLPRELVEKLLNATMIGNKKLLDKLIRDVSETEDAEFAHALQQLADKYEYDALTRLLEEVCS